MPLAPETGLRDIEYAVIDLETTGLVPGRDRIIEIAVCHVDRQGPPRVVLSSLVDPGGPVTGTEIHGLTSVDVAGAPLFLQLCDELARALAGRVIVAYNADHDLSFLLAEWRPTGFGRPLPHMCALRVRSALGRGWQPLGEACTAEGIAYRSAHSATYDALATAELFDKQLGQLAEAGITTLGIMRERWKLQFAKSLVFDPLREYEIRSDMRWPCKPRTSFLQSTSDLATYQNALMVALADLHVTPLELQTLAELRRNLALPLEFVRGVHARVFAMYLVMNAGDERIDTREMADIQKLWNCLATLGWAPGMVD